MQHIIQHLKAKEQLFIIFLEVLFSENLESLLVCEGLTSQRVAELGHLICDRADQGDWAVCSRVAIVDRLQCSVASLDIAIRMENLLLILRFLRRLLQLSTLNDLRPQVLRVLPL